MSESDAVQAFVEHVLRYMVRRVRNPTSPGAAGGIGSGCCCSAPPDSCS